MIELTPQAVVTPQAVDDKTTRIKANLGATKKIGARWRPRLSTAPAMEVLTSVQNVLDMRIADGLVHTHARLTYQVLRGQVDQLRIAVPLDHRILDVTAVGLKSWKSAKDEKSQVVTVDLLGGESKTIVVEVFTEHSVPEGAFNLAGVDDDGVYRGVHALGEVRENGIVVVGQSADLSLGVQQQSGLVRIEAAEVPEALRRPENQFYKYYTPKFRLQVAVKPVEPRLLVEHRTQLVFRDDEVQLLSQLTYTVERAGVFELRFKLPEGLKIDRVDCEPMKEFQTPEGADLLIIVLREKTLGNIGLTISGHRALDVSEKESRPLPLIEPQGTARENGTITVYAPDSLEIIADEKGVQGAQPTRPDASVPPADRPGPAGCRLELHAPTRNSGAHRTQTDTPHGGRRHDHRRPAGPDRSRDDHQLRRLFAGIDTFRFAVPEAVAAEVQIESADPAGAPIKQKSRADAAEDGWVTWTVIMQREVTGRIPIRVRYDLKPEQKDNVAQIAVQPVRILDAPGKTDAAPRIVPAAVSGEIMVQKDRSLSVSAKGRRPRANRRARADALAPGRESRLPVLQTARKVLGHVHARFDGHAARNSGSRRDGRGAGPGRSGRHRRQGGDVPLPVSAEDQRTAAAADGAPQGRRDSRHVCGGQARRSRKRHGQTGGERPRSLYHQCRPIDSLGRAVRRGARLPHPLRQFPAAREGGAR